MNKKTIKKLLVVTGGVLVLAAVILGIWVYQSNTNSNDSDTDGSATTGIETVDTVAATHAAVNEANGVEEGLKAYDDAIKNASNDTTITLNVNKSLYASSKGSLDTAVTAANEAIAKSDGKDNQAYFAAAVAYEQKGDYSKALENYKKALEAFNSDTSRTNSSSGAYYQKKITEMEGKL